MVADKKGGFITCNIPSADRKKAPVPSVLQVSTQNGITASGRQVKLFFSLTMRLDLSR